MSKYVHGTDSDEQERLRKLNELTNPPFIAFLAPQPHESILEVGSGLGILAGEVASVAARVVGIEYSPEQLAKATTGRDNLQFIRGDAHSLPFDDNCFDVVYCRYLLEHVRHPETVLAQMRRVLKPGGRICIQENDDAVFQLWPECPTWKKLWVNFCELQSRLGGDGYIGRKLHSYLIDAGFFDVELTIQPELHYAGTPSFELWMFNALKILEASGPDIIEKGLATTEELRQARSEIERFVTLKDAASYFYWNRARAVK
jgi:SAM-dependent methyltransferase